MHSQYDTFRSFQLTSSLSNKLHREGLNKIEAKGNVKKVNNNNIVV